MLDLARRRALLTAALGFAVLDTRGQPVPPAVQTVRTWLDTWTGLGHVVTGMQRQDYDLELTRHDGRGWQATFYATGMEHSLTSLTGTGAGPTPWRAVPVAAWNALGRAPGEAHGPTPAADVVLPLSDWGRDVEPALGVTVAPHGVCRCAGASTVSRTTRGRPSRPSPGTRSPMLPSAAGASCGATQGRTRRG